MRYIKKTASEPQDLQEYKRACRRTDPPIPIRYADMPKEGTRQLLAKDQGYLCAYCMRRVSTERLDEAHYLHIEHLVPQNDLSEEAAADFSNFLGVCPGNRDAAENRKKTCDAFRGTLEEEKQQMGLNPMDRAQMEKIYYLRNGEIHAREGDLDTELSEKLNLNGEATYLKENRETAYDWLVNALKKKRPEKEWNRAFLEQAWSLFCTPDENGQYREYVGVYAYWLRRWMSRCR